MAKLPKDMIFHYHSDDGITIKVDAIPLVRCKDCKWFKEFTDNGNPTGRGSCENDKLDMFHSPRVDWFCADGERKE